MVARPAHDHRGDGGESPAVGNSGPLTEFASCPTLPRLLRNRVEINDLRPVARGADQVADQFHGLKLRVGGDQARRMREWLMLNDNLIINHYSLTITH